MIRLSKHLSSHLRLCSRREADEWIARGKVLVNFQPVTELGFKVSENDVIKLVDDPKRRVFTVKNIQADTAFPPGLFVVNKLPGEILDPTKPKNLSSRLALEYPHLAARNLHLASGLDVSVAGLLLLTDSVRLKQFFERVSLPQLVHVSCSS